VTQQAATRPRLLVFSDARDGKARRVDGYLAQVLQRRGNHETFIVHRVEITERADLVERFGISTSPALVVVDQRHMRGKLERPRNAIEIQSLLAPWLR
jgi:hypothetical protein